MNSDLPKEMDSDPVETSIDLFSNQRNPLGADLSVGPGVVQAPQLLFRCARGGWEAVDLVPTAKLKGLQPKREASWVFFVG